MNPLNNNSSLVNLLLLLVLASNVWIGVTVQQGLSGGGSPAPSAPSAIVTPAPAVPGAVAPTPDANAQAANVKKVDVKIDYIKGDKNAAVSIIEYSDFQCPFCIRAYPTVQQLLTDYKGKVNLVQREYPLSFHENARAAGIAALCVGKLGGSEAYYKFADEAFSKGTSDPTIISPAKLPELAKLAGVNVAKWQSCFDAKETEARMDTDVKEGTAAGVNGTPGFILINNKTGKVESIAGAQPVASFEAALGRLGVTK